MHIFYSPGQYQYFDISIDHIGRPRPLTNFCSTGGVPLYNFEGDKIEGQHEGRPILSINTSN